MELILVGATVSLLSINLGIGMIAYLIGYQRGREDAHRGKRESRSV